MEPTGSEMFLNKMNITIKLLMLTVLVLVQLCELLISRRREEEERGREEERGGRRRRRRRRRRRGGSADSFPSFPAAAAAAAAAAPSLRVSSCLRVSWCRMPVCGSSSRLKFVIF